MPRLFTGSTLRYDFSDQSQLPWPDIEAACGRSLGECAREDIFEYRRWLQHEAGFFNQSHRFSEIEKLRLKLYEMCKEIDQTLRDSRKQGGPNTRVLALTAYLGRVDEVDSRTG